MCEMEVEQLPDVKAAEEIYKFVRDQYDKTFTARAMAQARIGHLLMLTGFLLTGLTGFGVPQLITLMTADHHFNTWISLLTTLTFISCLAIGISLAGMFYYLCQALKMFEVSTLKISPEIVENAIATHTQHQIHVGLVIPYMKAAQENVDDSKRLGELFKCLLPWLIGALTSVAAFVVLMVVTRYFSSFLG